MMKTAMRQTGFSLIELMIAALIGMILLGAVVLLAINASRTQQDLEQMGHQLENGRYAMKRLGDAITHAGFYGRFYNPNNPGAGVPTACDTITPANLQDRLWLPIQGYDSPIGNPAPNCIADADHVDDTDILVIRRAATEETAIGALTAGEVYIQGGPFNNVLATATGGETSGSPDQFDRTDDDGNLHPIRKFRVDIYHISPDDDGVPTLERLALREDGSGTLVWQEEPIAAGIENLQVDYGIDRDGDGRPEESDPSTATNDAYVTAPAAGNESDVVSVRVHLVARSIDPIQGYTDNKTLDLGREGTVDAEEDNYRRRVFVSTIRAENPSLRRE